MKRKLLTVALCLTLLSLSACQSQNMTTAEKYWSSAQKANNLNSYVRAQSDKMDLAALQAEASSDESTLSQQFQATALLCEIDCQGGEDASSYAESFLAKVNTDGEQFWSAFEAATSPYDCFLPMFKTAEQIDGQTLANLVSGIPEDSGYSDSLHRAIDYWVETHPDKVLNYMSDLEAAGYFDDWDENDWKSNFFDELVNPDYIKKGSTEEAIAYISSLRSSSVTELEKKYRKDFLQAATSEITGRKYYTTGMAITVNDTLDLKEPDEGNLPETIELEGKKVVAFYRNPFVDEFKGSPTALRVLGDFMLGLSQEEYPNSLEEADYYFVLTPSYEYGDYYQITSNTNSKKQQVISNTSIDLYEEGTGIFLRHLGTVREMPSSTVFTNYSDDTPEYPLLTQADTLYFIYKNVNTPETYATLVDQLEGKMDFQPEEPVSLGGWEITYHSCQIVESFVDGMFIYQADPGYRLARAQFTITNVGTAKNTFLPMLYYVGQDTIIQIADSSRENFYDCVDPMTLNSCLNSKSLAPGESAEGELIFQLPDDIAEEADSLYIMISLGYQRVFCPLGK